MFSKWWHYALALVLGIGVVGTALAGLAAALIYPNLPPLEALTDYKPRQPLRVYTADGALIAEFGEERRAFVAINKVPQQMKEAIIAAEDERFYHHGGVDTIGILRAATANLLSGGAKEGASTITMQVARNFFLSNEKTLTRKLSEAMLAIKIEHSLSKDKILELYINQIYLGQRAYGFEAAARTYFGKPLNELSLAEFAMLAGLPKAPSKYNPVVNFPRAKARQQYVLARMRTLKFISPSEYQQALDHKLVVREARPPVDVVADYAAEMVRQALFEKYGETIYSSGYKAITTLQRSQQLAANRALWNGVADYDHRHGYRGPEKKIPLSLSSTNPGPGIADALEDREPVNDMIPAVVVESTPQRIRAQFRDGSKAEITGTSLKWLASWTTNGKGRHLQPGSVIRLQRASPNKPWQLTQLPEVEGALVAVNPLNGGITALVGGFDYGHNKFNHVTQAWRQPGSSFKPFIYSAALDKGYTPATLIQDAPLTLTADEAGGTAWEPKNYDGSYLGPVRMRTALTKSLNLVSIRILQGIGPYYARDYIRRFGFDPSRHPPYLTMALGAGSVTPLQMASAYGVFANGGFGVKPYLIEKVYDGNNRLLMQAAPQKVGVNAPRVIDPRNAFLMTSMMQDVVRYGTAARAGQLGRNDIAGKTGTTNEARDGWFAGYNPGLVAIAWLGFDQPRSLGRGETGAQAALPIWINFMAEALKKVPNNAFQVPSGVVTATIDSKTGLRLIGDGQTGLTEYFYQENLPAESPPPNSESFLNPGPPADDIPFPAP